MLRTLCRMRSLLVLPNCMEAGHSETVGCVPCNPPFTSTFSPADVCQDSAESLKLFWVFGLCVGDFELRLLYNTILLWERRRDNGIVHLGLFSLSRNSLKT